MSQRTCSVEGCDKRVSARGWCSMHYCRWKKHGDPLAVKHKHDGNRVDPAQRKQCLQCGDSFGPSPRCAHSQWARRVFCSGLCANTWRARQQTKRPTTTRRQGERWARWWEQQRCCEDKADLATQARRQRRVDRATRPLPGPRLFIGSICRACGSTWVQYAARVDSDLCSTCTKSKWRMNDRKRAKYYGVEHEHIDRHRVFAEDGHVCQICKRKTKGKYPNPRSASIDHIIPLSRGGPDLRHNVQTACLECNVRKHNGAANDQLRLALAS